MPKYHVEKSIVIATSHDAILATLTDYRAWVSWSPWLIMEPECKLTYNDLQGKVGAQYEWQGDLVGAGGMQLESIAEQRVEMTLTFIKPFKSTAKVAFEVKPHGHGEFKVTWHMWGQLPFFLFFMTQKMKAWIGMDYERGLAMLKSQLESGSIPSKLSMLGDVSLPSRHYVGLAGQSNLKAIGDIMPKQFQQLHELFEDKGWTCSDVPFALYHDLDMVTGQTAFISALPVAELPKVEPPFIAASLPTQEAWGVSHIGVYPFLGNAWSFVMMASRHYKVRARKQPMGIERYMNDPNTTKPEDLAAQVLVLKK